MRRQQQIERLSNLGCILLTAMMMTVWGDFIYAFAAEDFHIPYFFQLLAADDLAWSMKMAALMVIGSVLIMLEDFA